MLRILLLCFVYFNVLFANPTIDDIQKIREQNGRILLQEENRVKFEKNSEQNPMIKINPNYYEVDQNITSTQNCFPVNSIEIHDNEKLSDEDLLYAYSRYENQCLNQESILNLLNEINNAYIKKGYITTKAYLKEQDLSTKILKVHVQEGKLENILVNDKNSTETILTFPFLKGNALNLRDIEMGLENFNRLYTTTTTLDLLEGTKAGYSIINVHKEQDKLYFVTLTANNHGSQSTGKETGDVKVYVENIFNLNSQFTFGLSGTLRQLEEKRTIGRSFNFTVPFGYFLFSAGYREFLYRSTIKGENANYVSSGSNSTYSYGADYVFLRDEISIVKLNLGLDIKQNLNFIANQYIQTSSNKLSVLTVGVSGSTTLKESSLSGGFSLKRGLTLFDPLLDSDDLHKKAQYTAYTLNLAVNTNIDILEHSFSLSNAVYAQYSDDKLYSTELFSIGGLYTVRGFEHMGYAGEIGAYMRNDLSYLIYQEFFGVNMAISPFVAYDLGFVEYDANIYKYMVGGAVGLKLQTRYVSFDLGLSFPLYAYDPVAEEETIFSFSATFNY